MVIFRVYSSSGPIDTDGPFLLSVHLYPGPINIERPWGRIHAEGPSLPRAHPSPGGPTMHWHRSHQGSSIPNVNWGLSMLMAHPCSEAIYAEGLLGPSNPKGLWGWRLIHAEGPFLPRAHLSQEPMGVYPCSGPIHVKGPYLPL